MDDHLRRLERLAATGDPFAKKRLDILLCKVEGCQVHVIKDVLTYAQPEHQCMILMVRLKGGDQIQTIFTDREILIGDFESIRTCIEATVRTLAHCPRCGEPNDENENLFKELQWRLSKILT